MLCIAVHGFVDVYYAANNNDPSSHLNFVPGAGTTAERANEFSLNLAEVDVSQEAAPVGFRLSVVAGDGADVVHAAESEGFRHIYQASVIYKPTDRLTLEGGIYPSHIGFEGFFSKDNWNYTRSWLGEFSPYYQTGVHAAYAFTKHWTGDVHVLNGWQNIDANNSAKAIGAKIAYANGKLSASLNTFDNHSRHFGDLIALYEATPKLKVAGSLDRGRQDLPGDAHASWLGVAGFARYEIDAKNAVAFRAERFSDPHNGITGAPQTLEEGTVTYELRPAKNLIVKIEARHDRGTIDNQTIVVFSAVATY